MTGRLPQRRRPAHSSNINRHGRPTILYVTVCTKDRRHILASQKVHAAVLYAWEAATQYSVGRYVIMPDHVHLFCAPSALEPEPVHRWVAYWKRIVSRARPELQPIWQKDCWDTQIRDVRRYEEKWDYVRHNPVRKGLVQNADHWPFQGVLSDLVW
jgi:putative transposase